MLSTWTAPWQSVYGGLNIADLMYLRWETICFRHASTGLYSSPKAVCSAGRPFLIMKTRPLKSAPP